VNVALSRQELGRRILSLPETERRKAVKLLKLVTPTESTPEFGKWMQKYRPEFDWNAPHFKVMQDALNRVTNGEAKRVFFQVPIRHGKTEHNTIGYAVYRLLNTPSRSRILVTSYNQERADWISRQIRRLAVSLGITPHGRDTMREWEVGTMSSVRAVGAGTGVAGVNADVILIDDPIGSREEAESQAHRDRVWDWITNDLLARCEPQTAVLFTMSRWHTDDPAGRLREGKAGDWEVIDLPGRAEPKDPLDREEDAPLWPEIRGPEWLDEMRAQMGEYGFASLIQGRPRPRDGGMFKSSWWEYTPEVPLAGHMIRYWDLAGTEAKGRGHDPDFSAGALMCRMVDRRTAIVDMARFRKSIADRDNEMARICIEDLQRYRGRMAWWIETEAGIAGADRTAILVRRLQSYGMPVYTEHPTGKKVFRAEPMASAAEAKNIVLVGNKENPPAWVGSFISEAADFPNGKHDDQIDAAAGAFSKLSVNRATVTREVLI
jgi:predicted phage terminase large subunit-like protein